MSGDSAGRAARARAWAAEAAPALVGHPLAEAQAAAAAAGLRTKIEPAGSVTTTEFGIGRVRIAVDGDEKVTGISAG